MLELFVDESEKPGKRRILALAGYLADSEKWKGLSEEWARVLEDRNLTYFHAKDLRSQNARLYRHLSFSERRSLVLDLARLTVKYALVGITSIICLEDYKDATSPKYRAKYGSAYGLCTDTLLLMLSDTLLTPEKEVVSVYIEDGHKNAREAQLRVDNYKRRTEPLEWPDAVACIRITAPESFRDKGFVQIGERGLVSKKRVKPVHAADLLAYLIGSKRVEGAAAELFEGVGDTLLKGKPHLWRIWTRERILHLVEKAAESDTIAAKHNEALYRLRRSLGMHGVKAEKFSQGHTMDVSELSETQMDEVRRQLEERE